MWRKSYITLVFIKKSDGRLCISPSVQVSFVCMRVCRVVYLFVCFPVLRVCMLPEGKQPVWGVICFYRGWQLITNPDKHWGRVEGRERERWQTRARERKKRLHRVEGLAFEFHWFTTEGFGSCCLLSLRESGLEFDHCAVAHLAHWQLINPRH